MNDGTCIDKLPSSYWCICGYGYDGDQCEIGRFYFLKLLNSIYLALIIKCIY